MFSKQIFPAFFPFIRLSLSSFPIKRPLAFLARCPQIPTVSPDAAVSLAGGQDGLAPGLVPELSSGQLCSAVVCLGLRKTFLSGTLLRLPRGGATLSQAASGRPCCGAFGKGLTHRGHVLSELSLGPLPSLGTSSRWVKTRHISLWTWCFCALAA